MEEQWLPTTEDAMKKIKDDGEFDALRLKIIRAVKENEDLRKDIVNQVKQSNILKQDGSEDMKPRQLSDAIYEELGRKIMGQISDEIWKVIRSNDNIKDDIRGRVEAVVNKMINPNQYQTSNSKTLNPSLSPSDTQFVRGESNGLHSSSSSPLASPAAREPTILLKNVANEPFSGLDSTLHQVGDEQRPGLKVIESEPSDQRDDPPAFSGLADEDSDLPPGFG